MEQKRFANLINWLESTSGKDQATSTISKSLKIINDVHMGRCISAINTIEKNNKLIKIPKKYLLNYVTVLKHISYFNSGINEFFKKYVSGFDNIIFQSENDEITSLYSKLDSKKIFNLTSHQLLTLYITLENKRKESSFWYPLLSCFPELKEYSGIPMTWTLKTSSSTDLELFNSLPNSTKHHALSQLNQFNDDIKAIDSILNNLNFKVGHDEYLWSWLAINTRCLYYKLPLYLPISDSKNSEASNITLVPFVDLINHSYKSLNTVAIETKFGYEISTIQKIEKDNHLWFTYGPHSDEFLQCEYGFSTLREEFIDKFEEMNIYNCVDISSIILKLLNSSKKVNVSSWLKQTSYYGDYTLGIDNVTENNIKTFSTKPSHRTRIAIAALIENDKEFKLDENEGIIRCPIKLEKFYDGFNDGEYYHKSETILLQKIIIKVKEDLNSKLESLNSIKDYDITKFKIVRNLLLNQLFLLNSF
ncbi:hypothetical protein C6P42_000508 [Pichia californica]|nr:hypothetical protein C6P42_000508 [[Candida] californica]